MTNIFTIRENPGRIIKTFEAKDFNSFVEAIGDEWSIGSEEGVKSFFFYDRFQVKALIGQNRLVCRA